MRTVIVEKVSKTPRFFYRETPVELKYQELQDFDEDEIDIFAEVGKINNILNFEDITVQERLKLEDLLRNSGYEPVYYDCDCDY